MAIAEADRTTAHEMAAVLKEVCTEGHADRAQIWSALELIERQQFQELLASPSITRDFAKRIKEAIGYQSPAVASAIQTDLERPIDRSELAAADLVKVVGDRQFLDFKELVARCPRRHQKN